MYDQKSVVVVAFNESLCLERIMLIRNAKLACDEICDRMDGRTDNNCEKENNRRHLFSICQLIKYWELGTFVDRTSRILIIEKNTSKLRLFIKL